jgi:hypothetical protein
MHRSRSDSARCRLQSTNDDLGMALASMLGPLTLPAPSIEAIPTISAPISNGYDSPFPLDWNVPPDAPPPRG